MQPQQTPANTISTTSVILQLLKEKSKEKKRSWKMLCLQLSNSAPLSRTTEFAFVLDTTFITPPLLTPPQ